MQQHVVRGDAGLAGIGQLAVGDVRRDAIERLPAIDQHWRLAAEFERHRHELLAGGAHHRAADRGAPGEEEVIERQGREGRANGGVARDDGDLVLGEGLGDQRDQEIARCWCELRRLDHRAIACGESGRERHQREREWVVPRGYDPDDAERLILDMRAGETHRKCHAPALAPHEAAQVLVQVVDPPCECEDFHDGGFVPRAMPEVGIERRFQIRLSREHRRTKLLQICAALGERWRPVPQKGGALPRQEDGERLGPRSSAVARGLTNSTSGDVEDRVCVDRLRRHGTLTQRPPRPRDRTRAGRH